MMTRTWKRLNDYFPDWFYNGSFNVPAKGGIFTYLRAYTNAGNWIGPSDAAAKLDLYYHGERSGNKIASEMLETLSNMKYPYSNYDFFHAVTDLLYAKYGANWQKLYDTTQFNYNPINNYDMVEEGNDSTSVTHTPNLTRENIRTPDITRTSKVDGQTSDNESTTRTPDITEKTDETRTPDLTEGVSETRKPNLTETDDSTRTPNTTSTSTITGHVTGVDNKVFGYNSTTAVPDSNSTTTENGTTTTKETGTETNKTTKSTTGTDVTDTTTTSSGTETIERTTTNSGTETTESTRSGSNTVDNTERETGNEKTIETQTGNDTTSTIFSHKLTRSGNIGVTTSQQMIQSERDLWIWNFIEQVCQDIDSVLTCNIW